METRSEPENGAAAGAQLLRLRLLDDAVRRPSRRVAWRMRPSPSQNATWSAPASPYETRSPGCGSATGAPLPPAGRRRAGRAARSPGSSCGRGPSSRCPRSVMPPQRYGAPSSARAASSGSAARGLEPGRIGLAAERRRPAASPGSRRRCGRAPSRRGPPRGGAARPAGPARPARRPRRAAARSGVSWKTNVCSPTLSGMQLRLDAADRLVELVEERRGPVVAEEAARRLFALRQAPVALARSLLAEVVEADARLAWNGDSVALARPLGVDLLLEDATYVVVDLETTGLRPGLVADLRDRRRQDRRLRDRRRVRDARRSRARRSARRSRRSPASPTGSCAARRAPPVAVQPVPALRGRRRARRAQRALRPLVSRPRDGAADRVAARRARRRHGRARAARARRPRAARVASRSSPISSARRCSRAIARFPTRRRRPRCCSR